MNTTSEQPSDYGPSPVTPKQKLVDNDRVRLTATALNNGAIAALVASVVGPAAAELYGITAPRSPYWWLFGLFWLIGAAGLYLIARRVLGDLEP